MPLKYADLEHEVLRRCPAGHPLVLRCRPVRAVGGRLEPFPTLFWLACDDVHRQLAKIEADGGIDRARRWLRDDAARLDRLASQHESYIAERETLLTENERRRLDAAGLLEGFRRRGIGGMLARDSVKCLHLHYAHHLARENVLGTWVTAHHEVIPCPAP